MKEINKQYLEKLCIEYKKINGKEVFIFESHHHALYPWALVRRNNRDQELDIISFDYHTDTIEPFLKYVYNMLEGKSDDRIKVEEEKLVKDIRYDNDDSILSAIGMLKNDEHIRTAIGSGIIDTALLVSYLGEEFPMSIEEEKRINDFNSAESTIQMIEGAYQLTPKSKRTYPKSSIYMADFDPDGLELFIEDEFLNRYLSELKRICGFVDENGDMVHRYILDIDLDYFMVPEAVKPRYTLIFSKLIKNAEAITIAKESACVDLCSEGRTNAEYLLDKVLELIEASL